MADDEEKAGEGNRISEAVIAFFNRGKRLAGSLLRENEQLRTRIEKLEQGRRGAAGGARGREEECGPRGGASTEGGPQPEAGSRRAAEHPRKASANRRS